MMSRMLKELALIVAGTILGVALLYESMFIHVNRPGATIFYGFPFIWNVAGDGPGVVCSGEGVSVFGMCLVRQWYANFIGDLAFWLAVSLTTVEVSSRVAIPYVGRQLRIHRSKRSTAPISTTSATA